MKPGLHKAWYGPRTQEVRNQYRILMGKNTPSSSINSELNGMTMTSEEYNS